MFNAALPLMILAGSDRRPGPLPQTGDGGHALSGTKAVDLRIGGRPLVQAVIDVMSSERRLGPIYAVGPADRLASVSHAARIVDSDGTFGENIRAAIEQGRRAHGGSPVAFVTCDVLLSPGTVGRLLDRYERDAPCDLWFPLVRAPRDPDRLGASSWKPSYRIRRTAEEPAVPVLPGHFVVADPEALRLEFVYRLMELGYRTRNRPIADRRGVVLRGLLTQMLSRDLADMARLRRPTLTWTVLHVGLAAARELRDGRITLAHLEDTIWRLFVTRDRRRRHSRCGVRLPLVDELELALDIDTEEEAREHGARRAEGA